MAGYRLVVKSVRSSTEKCHCGLSEIRQGASSPLEQTRHQLFLGGESFVERYRQDKIRKSFGKYRKLSENRALCPLKNTENGILKEMKPWPKPIYPELIRWRKSDSILVHIT